MPTFCFLDRVRCQLHRLVIKFPVTEQILPKLSKNSLFSTITTSKKLTLQSNLKELEQFLAALLTCSRTVLDSKLVQNIFETDEMRNGLYHVQYESDSPNGTSSVDQELDDDPFSKLSPPPLKSITFNRLEHYRFPAVMEEMPEPNSSVTHLPDGTALNPPVLSPASRSLADGPSRSEDARRTRTPVRNKASLGNIRRPLHAFEVATPDSSQLNSRLTRPKTSDPTLVGRRPALYHQSESDATLRGSNSVRAQTLQNPSSSLENDDHARTLRLASLPISQTGGPLRHIFVEGWTQYPTPDVHRTPRERCANDRPMTSGNAPPAERTYPHGATPRRAHDIPTGLVTRNLQSNSELQDSSPSDACASVPTPSRNVPRPTTMRKLSSQVNLRTHSSATPTSRRKMSDAHLMQSRPLRDDPEPLCKQDSASTPASESVTSPNRLVKPRPGLRPFKSMQDMRSSSERSPSSDTTPMPTPCPGGFDVVEMARKPAPSSSVGLAISTLAIPSGLQASVDPAPNNAPRVRRPTRQNSTPMLERGGSALRAGRHAIKGSLHESPPGVSPPRRLRSRLSVTSSSSSFGSTAQAYSGTSSASSVPPLNPNDPRQRRSSSTSSSGSLGLSEASAASPLQPMTPAQIQSQNNVVIDANNTSLLESGSSTSMRYVFDPDKGRFVGHHTIPPAPFFPLPPAPERKLSLTPGMSYLHDGARHAVQRRPHTAGGGNGGATAMAGRLGRPFALEEEPMKLKTFQVVHPDDPLAGSVTVKVVHAGSGTNVAMRVPKSIGLKALKARIESKLVNGAEIVLPECWELLVLLEKSKSGHLLCSDQDLVDLLNKTPLPASGRITLKLV